MRKKDYELIASQINLYRKNDENKARHNRPPTIRLAEHIAYDFANLLESSGAKFDRQKFLTACGIDDGAVYKSYGDLPAYDKPPIQD